MSLLRALALVALLLLPGVAAGAPALAERFEGIAAVTDGDTLRLGTLRVRLAVADAPETRQTCDLGGTRWACGAAATAALEALAAGRVVRCTHRGKLSYGRIVAMCSAGGTNLSVAMVAKGMALVDARFLREWPDLAPSLRAAEAGARAARRGLWAAHAERPAASRPASSPGT